MPGSNPDAQTTGEASQPPPQSGGPPQESPGGEPPLTPPVFPQRPSQQVPEQDAQRAHVTFATPVSTQTDQQAQQPQNIGLVTPIRGTLHRSPEELSREVGWTALTEAVTASAQALYPNDPKAVALTVANTLQPYMTAFSPARLGFEKNVFTSGMTPGTPCPKLLRVSYLER